MWEFSKGPLSCLLMVFFVTGCQLVPQQPTDKTITNQFLLTEPQKLVTIEEDRLIKMDAPSQRIEVAVYNFRDATGKFERGEGFPTNSRAVTQGGASMLIDTLYKTGHGKWFRVLDRYRIDDVLQERQLIRGTRDQYGQTAALGPVPPIAYSAVMVTGEIAGFDTNIETGGAGARYLGIGADTQYQVDYVTIYLRLVSVTSGEVLLSVEVSKTIYSVAVNGAVFKFVDSNSLLEMEAGYTENEPRHVALRRAIEQGVYEMVYEGSDREIWSFQDPDLAAKNRIKMRRVLRP